MKRSNVLNMIILVTVLLCKTVPASADSVVIWSCNAMGMTPIPQSVGLLEFRAGRAILKEDRRGTAVLVCPIGSVTEDMRKYSIRSLYMTHKGGDFNTPNPTNYMRAELRRVRMSDGHVETVPNSLVDSNKRNPTGINGSNGWVTNQSATSGNTIFGGLDFEKYHYYVQVTLKKERSDGRLSVMGVYLRN